MSEFNKLRKDPEEVNITPEVEVIETPKTKKEYDPFVKSVEEMKKDVDEVDNSPAAAPTAAKKKVLTEEDMLDDLASTPGKPRIRWNVKTHANPVIRVIEHEQLLEATRREIGEVESMWQRMADRGGTFVKFSNPDFDPPPKSVSYPTLNRHLQGMERGIVCVAGQPNIGKTVWLSNVMYDVYTHNPDAIIIDFILDDAIANRYVHLAAIESKRRYADIQQMENHEDSNIRNTISDALAHSRNVLTSGRWFTFERILTVKKEHVLNYQASRLQNLCSIIKSVREAFPIEKHPIVAFIDAYNNIDITGIQGCQSDFAKEERAIDLLEEAANVYGVILFMTTHLRKESTRRLMSLDSIKGSLKLPYQAKVTFYLHNDLKLSKESQVKWVDGIKNDKGIEEWTLPQDEDLDYRLRPRPLLEIYSLKSKVSDEQRPLYYRMAPERCGLYSPKDAQEYERLKSLALIPIVN